MQRLVAKGQRSGAPYTIDAILKASKFPILYLRPFQDDERSATGLLPFLKPSTRERKMVSAFRSRLNCSVVAISDPREELGVVGAQRIWITSNWQQKVLEFIRCAPVVILRVGTTDGIL